MPDSYYVYVYRDLSGNPLYFGQGLGSMRPGSHASGTHNPAFEAWLRANPGKYMIEVVGPLESKAMMDAVESALISACKSALALRNNFFNAHQGSSKYRFRPYGVPAEYAERVTQPIGSDELTRLAAAMGPIMLVYVNQKDFDDGPGRVGYDPASPPPDESIRARIEAWWQVKRLVKHWATAPESSPRLLLGVTGGAGAQQIIAAAEVDQLRWAFAESKPGGLLKIPLVNQSLDAAGLRGRPIMRELGLRFGNWRQEQFRFFDANGLR